MINTRFRVVIISEGRGKYMEWGRITHVNYVTMLDDGFPVFINKKIKNKLLKK